VRVIDGNSVTKRMTSQVMRILEKKKTVKLQMGIEQC
jgi:hypothetical protein